MSSAQAGFSRAGGEQLEETPAREGCSALSRHHLIPLPPKKTSKKGAELSGSQFKSSKLGASGAAAQTWRPSLELQRSLFARLVGETCQGFLNDNHSSFLFASPHPSPPPGICHLLFCWGFFSGSEPLALTVFTLTSLSGVNYYR